MEISSRCAHLVPASARCQVSCLRSCLHLRPVKSLVGQRTAHPRPKPQCASTTRNFARRSISGCPATKVDGRAYTIEDEVEVAFASDVSNAHARLVIQRWPAHHHTRYTTQHLPSFESLHSTMETYNRDQTLRYRNKLSGLILDSFGIFSPKTPFMVSAYRKIIKNIRTYSKTVHGAFLATRRNGITASSLRLHLHLRLRLVYMM